MALLRFRPLFRRLALSLAAAQLVAYAAAPVVEALTEHAPGPVAIESGHGKACFPLHQEATCLACQMVSLTARRPDGTQTPALQRERTTLVPHVAKAAAPRAPPPAFLTRAPPTLG